MKAKPSLEPILRALAARERRDLGEHLTMELLVAYRAGELSAEDDEKIRDHLALCRECAQLLLDLVEFEEAARAKGASSLSDSEVEAAWQRLQERLAAPDRTSAEPSSSAPEILPFEARSSKYDTRSMRRRLRVLYALAACLLIGVVFVSAWGIALWQRTHRPKANEVVADAFSDKVRSRGSEPEGVAALPGDDLFVLVLHPEVDGLPSYPEYGIEIRKAGSARALFERIDGLVPVNGNFTLRLPGNKFGAGEYQVTFYGVKGRQWQELDTLSFTFSSSP